MLFDPPLDATYVWYGLAVVSLATLGVALSLPTTAPPDAATAAATVEDVTTATAGAVATRPVRATAVRVASWRLALRNRAGTSAATLAFGPVTPARTDGLRAVLGGDAPATAFDSADAFERALAAARQRSPGWTPTDGTLTARRVSWEGVDATLVG